MGKKRTLPNLNALRVFEAAGRHLSFRAAAEELHITHSAVSHRIRNLEEQLGVDLFARDGRAVTLTEAGRVYLPILTESLDRIDEGAALARSLDRAGTLTVQVYITVAMCWLLPRMQSFLHARDELRTQLSTSFLDWDFDRSGVDCGIIWTHASRKHEDLRYFHLTEARLRPMCHPSLVGGPDGISSSRDLPRHRLLQLHNNREDWATWFRAEGMEHREPDDAITFDSYLLAQEAAREGRGVTLTNGPFGYPPEPDDDLVRPFGERSCRGGDWYLVCRPESAGSPKIRAFHEWLLAELTRDDARSGTAGKEAAGGC